MRKGIADSKERRGKAQEDGSCGQKSSAVPLAVTSPVAICMQSKANAIGDSQQWHKVPLLPLLH